MSIIQRDSFPFFRSFYEGMECLSDKDRLSFYEAIFEYALNGNQPELKKNLNAMFTMIRPTLAKSRKMWENGCKGAEHGSKGGAPKGNQNARKQGQDKGKTTPKQPLNKGKTIPNKDRNKDKEKNKEEIYISEEEKKFYEKMFNNYPNVMGMSQPLTFDEWTKAYEKYGDAVMTKLSQMENNPFLQSKYVSAYLTLINWCNKDNK